MGWLVAPKINRADNHGTLSHFRDLAIDLVLLVLARKIVPLNKRIRAKSHPSARE